MKKRWFAIFLIITSIIALLAPLFLDYYIFGNSVPSNISYGEWASFLGGYLGAIIGGIFSLIGIILTIRFTSKENDVERRLQVSPFLSFSFTEKKNAGIGCIFCENRLNGDINIYGELHALNVGFGPVTSCGITDVKFNDTPMSVSFSSQNAIAKEREICIPFGLSTKRGKVEDEYLILRDDISPIGRIVKPKTSDEAGAGTLSFCMFYRDVLGTMYSQEIDIKLSVNYYTREPNGALWYAPSLSLEKVGPRTEIVS